eukprot:SAG22_NODE_11347_length_489_cov_1.002564_1_plen_30_part_01
MPMLLCFATIVVITHEIVAHVLVVRTLRCL